MSNKYRGLDGQLYDTFDQQRAADERYRDRKKQNQLLKEQNQLMEAQQRAMEEQNNRLMREQRNLELERMRNEQALERSRQTHEEEMRLSRLCDEVGINKKLMDEFIEYLFNNKFKDEEETKKLEKLYTQYTSYGQNLLYLEGKEESQKEDKEKLNMLNKILEGNYSYGEQIGEYKLRSYINDYDEHANDAAASILTVLTISLGLILLLVFCTGGFTFESIKNVFTGDVSIVTKGAGIILIVVSIIKLLPLSKDKKNIRNCAEEIRNKILNDKSHNKNVKERIKELKEENKDIEKKYFELKQSCIQTKVDDFYDFRLKHYNAQLEKLLYDFELPKKMENEKIIYKSVNKHIAENNGDIEDYVAYFESINEVQ